MEANKLMDDCKSGWLMVEKDFTARLFKPEQLKYALQCMGRNPSDKVVSRYWSQCGGSMSYEQFCLVMKREHKTTMRDLMSSFRKIDLNGDGYITAEELHKVLTKRGEKMSHDEVQAIIDEADQNGDGKLDYAEFSHMLLNTSEECISAAKQKAGGASSSSHHKWSSSKHKSSHHGSPQRSSFDRQRQREDIRAQLFPQGSSLSNGYHPQDKRALPPDPPLLPARVSGSISPQHSQLPSLATPTTQEPILTTRTGNLQDSLLVATTAEPTPVTGQTEHAPQVENQANTTEQRITSGETSAVQNGGPTKDLSSLPDPLELRANSLTKLPPLKKTPLPPLVPLSVGATGSELPKISTDPPKENLEAIPQDTESKPSEQHASSSPAREQSSEQPASSNEPESGTHVTSTVPPTSTEDSGEQSTQAGDSSTQLSQAEGSSETPPTNPPQKERVDGGRDSDRQTDHLENGRGGEEVKKKETAPPSCVFSPPPKKPKNIQSWNSISGKGCFYLDLDDSPPAGSEEDEGVIRCHHYRLKLPSPTNVWIEVGVAKPGNPATDTLLFVFRTDDSEEPTDLITYTQHRVGERWVCKLDLDMGTYALIPFTSGCHLRPREDEEKEGVALLSEEGGRVSLSEECCGALKEVFQRMDLDGNGFISRTEFDFFQERTSGDICDDDSWKVIQDNFELTEDDELTLRGFLDLHVMTAEDEEGGAGEVREVLQALGYSSHLQLDQACPFVFDVFTEDNEGEIEIVDLLPSTPHTDPALCRLIQERGVCEAVSEGKGVLYTHTFSTPHMTTVVVENKSSRNALVQLDCTQSTNCVYSRDSPIHVLPVAANSVVIGMHIQPLIMTEPYKIDCIASKILT